MTKLDLSKPVQTRGGDIAGAILAPDGFLYGWLVNGSVGRAKWSADGTYWPQGASLSGSFVPCPQDLVNVPERRTVKRWINVYDTDNLGYHGYPTRDEADRYRGAGRIACIEREITYTVGEGLDP